MNKSVFLSPLITVTLQLKDYFNLTAAQVCSVWFNFITSPNPDFLITDIYDLMERLKLGGYRKKVLAEHQNLQAMSGEKWGWYFYHQIMQTQQMEGATGQFEPHHKFVASQDLVFSSVQNLKKLSVPYQALNNDRLTAHLYCRIMGILSLVPSKGGIVNCPGGYVLSYLMISGCMLRLLPTKLLLHSKLIPSPAILSKIEECCGEDYITNLTSNLATLLPALAQVLDIPLFLTENIVSEYLLQFSSSPADFVDLYYQNLGETYYYVTNTRKRMMEGSYFVSYTNCKMSSLANIVETNWPKQGWPDYVLTTNSDYNVLSLDIGDKELPPNCCKKRKKKSLTLDEQRLLYLFPTNDKFFLWITKFSLCAGTVLE